MTMLAQETTLGIGRQRRASGDVVGATRAARAVGELGVVDLSAGNGCNRCQSRWARCVTGALSANRASARASSWVCRYGYGRSAEEQGQEGLGKAKVENTSTGSVADLTNCPARMSV